jgi:hypothetical protein
MAELVLVGFLCLLLDPSVWLAGLRLLERWEGADPREIVWKGAYPV